MRNLWLLALLLVVKPTLGQESAPLDIDVRAKVKLVRYQLKDAGKTIDLGLAVVGEAEIALRNISEEVLRIEDLEVGNLAFVDPTSGAAWPMVHPCAVVGACKPGAGIGRRVVALKPGEEHRVTIDEFGCAGSFWKTPPPGEYDLIYRVRLVSEAAPLPPWCEAGDWGAGPNKMTKRARDLLGGEAFWKGAVSSRPQRVHFQKVRTEQL